MFNDEFCVVEYQLFIENQNTLCLHSYTQINLVIDFDFYLQRQK